MMIDSGNLAQDLVSLEFAELIGAEYRPHQQKVGTAAKGGTVTIVGRCKPIKLFIENVPQAVVIKPYVVKELSCPINVGRAFLGRYKGKLEFSPEAGFLEIQGQKTRLISRSDVLNCPLVTDSRIKKKVSETLLRDSSPHQGLVYDGREGACTMVETISGHQDVKVTAKEKVTLDPLSAKFVRVSTNGQAPVRESHKADFC